MSITTYAELKTAVANWIHRDDLTSYLDDIIMKGEQWIFRNVRTRDMETSLSGTITSGVVALPSDYVQLKSVWVNNSPIVPLEIVSEDYLYEKFPQRSGAYTPEVCAVQGSNLIFGPYGEGLSIAGRYYKRLTAISSSANALFTSNPDLYLSAALVEVQGFVKDEKRIPIWTADRDRIAAAVNAESQNSRLGNAMRVRAA